MNLSFEVVGIFVGMIVILFSIWSTIKVGRTLKINKYSGNLWFFVVLPMLILFLLGYGVFVLIQLDLYELPISYDFIVLLVYFFGALFTLVTLRSVRKMQVNILGKDMSNEDAYHVFENFIHNNGITMKSTLQDEKFNIQCSDCHEKVEYTIPDLIRSNAENIERGITIEKIFGTINYILYPVHRCGDGRREHTVVHDDKFDVRSVEKSRLIIKGVL